MTTTVDPGKLHRALNAIDALGLDLDAADKASPWRDLRSARDRLRVLAEMMGGTLGLAGIVKATGLSKSSVHRHQAAITVAGLADHPLPAEDASLPSEPPPSTSRVAPLAARVCACGPRALIDSDGDCARCGRIGAAS